MNELMALSNRVNLRLSPEQLEEVAAYARRNGVGLGSAIRLLIGQALQGATQTRVDSPAALAALLAAEHAVLMVASVLPEGERRMRELGQRASLAAEERLALFTSEPTGAEVER
jgi:hypothetical protein